MPLFLAERMFPDVSHKSMSLFYSKLRKKIVSEGSQIMCETSALEKVTIEVIEVDEDTVCFAYSILVVYF